MIDELGITVNKAADRACVNKRSIYKYADGKSLPDVSNLRLICLGLGVSADWLLGFDVPEWR